MQLKLITFFIYFLSITLINQGYGWSFFGSTNDNKESGLQKTKEKIIIIPIEENSTANRDLVSVNESQVTHWFANELKKVLISDNDNLEILVNDNKDAINDIDAKLYINLLACKAKDKTRFIDVYYTLHNPSTDLWNKKNSLNFLPINQSYKIHIKESESYSNLIHKKIIEKKVPKLQSQMIGVPIKSLKGIIQPQITIEIGLYKKEDYQTLLKILQMSLTPLAKIIATHSTVNIKDSNDKTDILPLSLD